jgi:C4-type Zn-finger protein
MSDRENPLTCPSCRQTCVPYGVESIPGKPERINLHLRCPQCGHQEQLEVNSEDLPYSSP